jgi:NADH-quinone oxidoreductase subunit C
MGNKGNKGNMDNTAISDRLRQHVADHLLSIDEEYGDLVVTVRREAIREVARFLRDDTALSCQFLENLCGVDYLGRDPRFEMVYHVLSFTNRHRVCLKVGVPEDDPTVPSLTALWPTANWQEREAYDMFGIIFTDHPSLERILMPDDWEGHPQRKDVALREEEVAFTFNAEKIYAQKVFATE